MAVQSFKNLHTFRLRQPCWWERLSPQPIFPYNIMQNSQTSFAARYSVFVGPNDFKFGIETRFMVLQAISKFEKGGHWTSPLQQFLLRHFLLNITLLKTFLSGHQGDTDVQLTFRLHELSSIKMLKVVSPLGESSFSSVP